MKTLKNTLCVLLSILMIFSSVSLVAFAEGETVEPEYTYTLKQYSEETTEEYAKITLDAIDELLAGLNNGEGIKFAVKVLGKEIGIDLTSVTAVCGSLDLIKSVDGLLGLCGDLKELNFDVWQTKMSRPKDDVKILKELFEFLGTKSKKNLGILQGESKYTNAQIIGGLLDGNADLGILNEFLDLKELLGADGVSGMVKELIFGLVFDKNAADFSAKYNEYKDDVDAFVYGPLLDKYAGEYLNGFTMTADTTVEPLIVSLFNALITNYVIDWVKGLNIDLAAREEADLKALAGVINLNGSTYDLSGISLDANVGLLQQVNDLVGKIFKQLVPGFEWVSSTDYKTISTNIEGLFKYVGKTSGLIPNADTMTREQIVMEIIAIVLRNVDTGAYGAGVTAQPTLKDMAKTALVNTAKEMGIPYTYTADQDFLVVVGDILATWAYNNFGIKDNNNVPYLGGKGDDVWTVANYFANYFLFDRGAATFFNLKVSKTDSVFKKIDAVIDLFGSDGDLAFDSEKFIKTLIDDIFTLDIEAILANTAVPALEMTKNKKAVEFVYNIIAYLINNWTDKDAISAYTDKAFTTLLSNDSVINLLVQILYTLNERKDSLVDMGLFIAGLILAEKPETDLGKPEVKIADYICDGFVADPDVSVNLGGESLVKNKDFIVITDGKDIGKASATIKFIGRFKGADVTAEYNIKLGTVANPALKAAVNSVTVTWNEVPGAAKYIIYVNGAEKATVSAGEKTAKEITGLAAATKYTVTVKAVDANGGTTESAAVSAYTNPAKVSGLKVSSVTASSMKLTWTKATGKISGYEIWRSLDGKTWTKLATTTKTTYTDSKLTSYTSYKFKVRAYTTDGATLYGDYSSVVTQRTKLGAVDVESSATSSSIKLSWDKVAGAKGYRIEVYNAKAKKWVKVATTAKLTYTLKKDATGTALKAGTQYSVRVCAYVSSSVSSAYDTVKLYTKLVKVPSLKASSIKTTSAKLTWKKATGATSYVIYKSTDGKKWTKVASTTKTTYTVSKLATGTSYKLKVVGYNKSKKIYSDDAIVSIKTLVGKVDSLKATAGRGSATLKWAKEPGATGYEIYSSTDGKKWTKAATTSKTTHTVSKLKRRANYQFKVRAYTKSGKTTVYGAYSSVAKVKTK